MSRHILVTGANGFVGEALCIEARKRGHRVRGAVRGGKIHIEAGETVSIGVIDHETQWREAVHGVDVVIHLAARVHVMHERAKHPLEEFCKVNVVGTERLARAAAAAGVRRFVYVSSIKVNGEETSDIRAYSEEDTPDPQDNYAVSKLLAEQALKRIGCETGMEIVIVRPPLVYGAHVKGNFAQMMSIVLRGIPLPFSGLSNQRSLLYVGNLVDALLLCAVHHAAAGQTYLVSDLTTTSTPELLRQLGVALGRRAILFRFPIVILRLAGRLIGRSNQIARLTGSLRIDARKIQFELGWTPPFTQAQGLHETAAWFRKHVWE